MLPAYTLTVDITADNSIGEEEFRERVSPCLTYLDALKGAFDKVPSDATFYPPTHQGGVSIGWSVRCVVLISVGKQRAEYLVQLYDAIVHLIAFELPDYEVRADTVRFEFS